MSTPKPEPPGYTEEYTKDSQVAAVPATSAVGKSAHFEEIYALRRKWCDLDIQLEKEKDPTKQKELEESMAKVIEKLKQLQSDTYTIGRMKPTCKTKSMLGFEAGRRLHTRRRKHRNGSTRIQRHRASRVSRRKRQTRRA